MANPADQQTKELLRTYLSSQASDNKLTTTVSEESGVIKNDSDIKEYPWAPDLEEVFSLFAQIKGNTKEKEYGYINFTWQCPGRRKPHEEVSVPEPEKVVSDTSRRVEVETDDFDFAEEIPASSMAVRPSKPVKKVNKKPVSLAGILSNMERHRIMDEIDKSSSEK